jgi:ABC-2 type transport system permease protein
MTIRNTLNVIRKDLTAGPRVLMVAWLIAMPLIMTVVLRLVFGGLIESKPRLGIVDLGDSSIPEQAQELDGIEISILESEEELKALVTDFDLDAGLVLQPGFDEMVRSGEFPQLQLYVSGESLASDQIVLVVTSIDLIRGVAGSPAPVEVATEIVGDGQSLPIQDRLAPFLVLLAVALSAIFLPAASLLQEREKGTIQAILATPASASDLLVAKGTIGLVLALLTGILTLFFNLGFGTQFWSNLAVVAVAGLMCAPIGLILGAAVKDMQTMFSVWKSGGIVLFAPDVSGRAAVDWNAVSYLLLPGTAC